MEGIPIEFDIRPNGTPQGIRRNVRHALGLHLPEVWRGPERASTLTIVASGPSAARAPLDRPHTLAVNGALALFTRAGLAPTYWAAADPQKSVVDFLGEMPVSTTYLVASKCHPAVFKRLRNRRVLVWHIEGDRDPWHIPMATTVTLNALELGFLLGWRRMETWGWDGCVMGGLDHALPQRHQGERRDIRVHRRDGAEPDTFVSTGTWAAEADDAVLQLSGAPYAVKVRGGGMIGAILDARLPKRPERLG